ncbi:hypothetical protein C1645_763837 [Glomus cerebriforme]|uniref:Uncharacterized protein n=1 Tax=Glomus cerebriforme TaxID=658196 RepID=A0A397T7N7_9GLOM|nr:hypothetical protein C1645_763837 [Glomus cerebriforme]
MYKLDKDQHVYYNQKKYNEIILPLSAYCIIGLFLRLSKHSLSLLSFSSSCLFILPTFPFYIVQIPGPIRPLSFGCFSHKCPGYDSSSGRFVHPKPQATRSSRIPLYQINYIK